MRNGDVLRHSSRWRISCNGGRAGRANPAPGDQPRLYPTRTRTQALDSDRSCTSAKATPEQLLSMSVWGFASRDQCLCGQSRSPAKRGETRKSFEGLAEQALQLDAVVGFGVAIFDDDGSV